MTGMTFSRPPAAREHYQQRVASLCRADPQVRAAAPDRDVLTAAQRPGLSLAESVDTVMTGYADRPALGERVREIVTDQATGTTRLRLTRRLRTITYRDLWSRASAIAAGLHHDPRVPVRRGDFVATLGFVSSDYVAVELACIRLGAVSVPLQATAAPDALKPIIAETAPRLLATSVGSLGTAVEAVTGSQTVRRLVVFDYAGETDAHRRALGAARSRLARAGSGIVIDTLADVAAAGTAFPAIPVAAAGPAGADP
ncbi:MAG: AMP-binding protein, partial [Actinobacteria bacterium]|nr:AMP-binding protein [Actinomycetota bacterium]